MRVVDSHSITAGLGTQVMLAAEAAASGASADEVVALVDDLAARTHVFGALDTLDNLKKGGRIGGAQALVGSLLSIKPILDISSGKVEEAGKARTRKKALEVLRDKVADAGAIEHLTVHHGFAPDVDEMLDLLDPIVPREQIRVGVIGPVIGTHGGPRVMGVTWVVGTLTLGAREAGRQGRSVSLGGPCRPPLPPRTARRRPRRATRRRGGCWPAGTAWTTSSRPAAWRRCGAAPTRSCAARWP